MPALDAQQPVQPQKAGGAEVAVGRNPNPRVLPINSTPYGKTYGEWGAAWWQWATDSPVEVNPMMDPTGEHCALNQSGPVWFLAGTQGRDPEVPPVPPVPTVRRCVVPAGKALFFPLVDFVYWAEVPTDTHEEMVSVLNWIVGLIEVIEVDVDGAALEDPFRYRAVSPLFTLQLDEGDIYDQQKSCLGPTGCVGAYDSVTDGYWIMLPPMSVGQHTIRFYGKFGWVDPDHPVLEFDVT